MLSCIIVLQVAPVVEYCPGDLWVIAKNGSAIGGTCNKYGSAKE
jgi:hypothetical protein